MPGSTQEDALVRSNLGWVAAELKRMHKIFQCDPEKAPTGEGYGSDIEQFSWKQMSGQLHDDDYEVFKWFASPDHLFIDIGANSGYSATSIWSSGSKGSVLSFEALKLHQQNLTAIRNSNPQIFDFKIMGLGQYEGHLTFFVPAVNGACITGLATAAEKIHWPSFAEYTIRGGGMTAFGNGKKPELSLVRFEAPVRRLGSVDELTQVLA